MKFNDNLSSVAGTESPYKGDAEANERISHEWIFEKKRCVSYS